MPEFDIPFVGRDEWGARDMQCSPAKQSWSDVRELFIHYMGPGNFVGLNSFDEAKARMRQVQNFHMDDDDHEWCDIGYNVVQFQPRGSLDKDHSRFIGRCRQDGRLWVPAAQFLHNERTVAVLVVMGSEDTQLLQATKESLWSLVRMCNRMARRDLPVRGHSEVQQTACPGPLLRGYIPNLNAAA